MWRLLRGGPVPGRTAKGTKKGPARSVQQERSAPTPRRGGSADPKVLREIERLGVGKRVVYKRRGARFGSRRHVVASTADLLATSGRSLLLKGLYGGRAKLVAEAETADAFPPGDRPEVAVAGRSNVGKSSLLRALSVKRLRIHTDARPGTTTAVGFYDLGRSLRVVDLPGYGFAFVTEERRRRWAELMDVYFRTRPHLRRVLVLLDARHGAKKPDLEFFERLDQARVRFQAVLTKTDLVKPADLARQVELVRAELRRHPLALSDQVLMVNSLDRAGVPEVWAALAGVVDPTKLERVRERLTGQVKELAIRELQRDAAERRRAEREQGRTRRRPAAHGGPASSRRGSQGGGGADAPSSASAVRATVMTLARNLAKKLRAQGATGSGTELDAMKVDLSMPLLSVDKREHATTALFGKAGGHLMGQQHKMSDKRRARVNARNARRAGLPVPKAAGAQNRPKSPSANQQGKGRRRDFQARKNQAKKKATESPRK